MAAILDISDFKDRKKFYYIPSEYFEREDYAVAAIDFAQQEFCDRFKIEPQQIDNEEKKEALRFYTWSIWAKSMRNYRTGNGASADPQLIAGQSILDIRRIVYCENYAIRIMNKYLPKENQVAKLLYILNY